MTRAEDIRTHTDRVLAQLHNDVPVSEGELFRRLGGGVYGLTYGQVQIACNDLQARNLIRWVSFQGWCKSDRP